MSNVIALPAKQAGLSEVQLAKRREGIGGSDISAIVGLNPWASPMDVYLDKVEGIAKPVTPPMERGIFLEEGIARWYAYRTGSALRTTGTIQHPSLKRVMCTPDFLATKDGVTVDLSIKAPGPWTKEEWGEEGTDQIPSAYIAQATWEMGILKALHGIDVAHVAAAPIDGDIRMYVVRFDEDFFGDLVNAAHAFWFDHVAKRIPPPVDGSEAWSRRLAEMHPRPTKVKLAPTPEAVALAERLRAAKEAREKAEELEKEARNQLAALIGDAEGIEGLCSYGFTKGRMSVDYEAVCREAGIPESLIQKYSRVGDGHRTLRMNKVKK